MSGDSSDIAVSRLAATLWWPIASNGQRMLGPLTVPAELDSWANLLAACW